MIQVIVSFAQESPDVFWTMFIVLMSLSALGATLGSNLDILRPFSRFRSIVIAGLFVVLFAIFVLIAALCVLIPKHAGDQATDNAAREFAQDKW